MRQRQVDIMLLVEFVSEVKWRDEKIEITTLTHQQNQFHVSLLIIFFFFFFEVSKMHCMYKMFSLSFLKCFLRIRVYYGLLWIFITMSSAHLLFEHYMKYKTSVTIFAKIFISSNIM